MTLIDLNDPKNAASRGDVPEAVRYIVEVPVVVGDPEPEFFRNPEGVWWDNDSDCGQPASEFALNTGYRFARPATAAEIEKHCTREVIAKCEGCGKEIIEGEWHGTWADGVTTCGKCSPPEVSQPAEAREVDDEQVRDYLIAVVEDEADDMPVPSLSPCEAALRDCILGLRDKVDDLEAAMSDDEASASESGATIKRQSDMITALRTENAALAATVAGMREALEAVNELIEQYTRIDFYHFITSSVGKQSDPMAKAIEAKKLLTTALERIGNGK